MDGKYQTKYCDLLKEWIKRYPSTEQNEDFVDSYHIDEICLNIDKQDWIKESFKLLLEYKKQIQHTHLNTRLSVCISCLVKGCPSETKKIDIEEPPEVYLYNKDNKNILDTLSQWTRIAQISGNAIYSGVDWYEENIIRILIWITPETLV